MFGMRKRAVRARIKAAGLPAEVAEFVAVIVRRTRLRRGEQVDVASELLSHFAEGLAAGKTERELIAAYGEPRTSARALRNGAIAKRGALDRALSSLIRWGLRSLVAVVAFYLGYATLLALRTPNVSFDAVAAVNARMPKPGSEGAAIDVYVSALSDAKGQCLFSEWIDGKGAENAARNRLDQDLPLIEFDAAALARVREDLTLFAPRIALLRTVKDRPVLGFAADTRVWSDSRVANFFHVVTDSESVSEGLFSGALLNVVLPQCAMLRSSAKLMCADAAVAIMDGRADDFMTDIEAASAMAAHAGEVGFLVNALVESGIQQLTLRTIVSAMENHGERFSDAQLARLDEIARTTELEMARGFDAERYGMVDLIQRCYSDDGAGDGVLLSNAFEEFTRVMLPAEMQQRAAEFNEALVRSTAFLSGPIAAHITPGRRAALAALDEHLGAYIDAANSPSRKDSLAKATAADCDFETRRDAAGPLLGVMMPALARYVGTMWASRAMADTARAAIGIERFRRANARFPANRAELEKFLGWQLDARSHEQLPWQYALVDGRPLIYDAGLDGLDDRARTPLAQERESVGATEEPEREASSRLVSLIGATADRLEFIAARDPNITRTASSVAADSPLDPTQPLIDADPSSAALGEGDHVRVWWKSGAAGWSRVVPAREVTPPRS